MKANKAPEKLYLSKNIYSTYLYQVPDPDDDTAIEYTRTDAFIEKALEWLCNNYDKYIRVIGSSIYPAYAELCKDFQKAMEN